MGRKSLLYLQVFCFLFLMKSQFTLAEKNVAEILDLTEKAFFGQDQSLIDEREAMLLDTGFEGIAVNAPHQILTAKHDSLPLAIAARYSGTRGWAVPLKDNTLLVAMNLESGKVNFSKAFSSERDATNRWPEPKEPRGAIPSGLAISTASLKLLDVRQQLNIDWMSGKWALGAIYYDWPSNIITLDIEGEKKQKSHPLLSIKPTPDLRGSAFLPNYLPTGQTPPQPESGLIFKTSFKVEKSEPQLNVFGSFSLPIDDFHLPAKKMEHHFLDGSKKNVAALIPVTFAVIGLDWDEPIQFDWIVPVYGENAQREMSVKGNFSIDALTTDLSVELPAGEYVCYILTPGQIFGPNTFLVP